MADFTLFRALVASSIAPLWFYVEKYICGQEIAYMCVLSWLHDVILAGQCSYKGCIYSPVENQLFTVINILDFCHDIYTFLMIRLIYNK